MRTLTVVQTVGSAVVGTAYLGPKFQTVPIGKCLPALHSGEDARALARCGFLDASVPIEINLLAWRPIQAALLQRKLLAEPGDGSADPEILISRHAIIGSISPEVLSEPNPLALSALSGAGVVGHSLAELRATSKAVGRVKKGKWRKLRKSDHFVSDPTYWERVSQQRAVYTRFLGELVDHGKPFAMALFAPPVPPIHARYSGSAELQGELNAAAAEWARPRSASTGSPGLLYNFSVMPSAFRDPDLVRGAIKVCSEALSQHDNRFHGVYLSISDLARISVSRGSRVRMVRDLVRELVSIANQSGMFVWIAEAGPAGISLLDEGASYTSYRLGMGSGPSYALFKTDQNNPPSEAELWTRKFGQVLSGPYGLELLQHAELSARGWLLTEENGRTSPLVPAILRKDPDRFRVEFGKPNNVAVLDRLNELWEREIVVNGNARAGRAAVARSSEPAIRAWGD